MSYYVYIIESDNSGRKYVGSTNNLERRIHQHNRGENSSTRKGIPYRLIYFESFESKELALKRERFFKTGKGREVFKKLLEGVRH